MQRPIPIFIKKLSLFCLILFFSKTVLPNTVNPQLWSDPETWGGTVPGPGEDVAIPLGQTIILDVSPPELGAITVMGRLIFEDLPLDFTAESIMIMGGALEIGTEADPIENDITITLTGEDNSNPDPVGRFIMVMNNGLLSVHGVSKNKLDWTQVNEHALIGQNEMTLKDSPVGWQVGDEIVIASSTFNPEEAELLSITAINENTVSFQPSLEYNHFGELQDYGGKTLDERAEVGMLSRNIVIQGAADSPARSYGAHVMIMEDSDAQIAGVEFVYCGQKGREARYPIHWHFSGVRPESYARHNSIHHSFHRAIVTHGTDQVSVEHNVAYNIFSHTFVPAEDGIEMGNKYNYNLGILTKRLDSEDWAFRMDNGKSSQSEHRPGTFWLRNPFNEMIGNHAAGSKFGNGFYFDMRHLPHQVGVAIRNNDSPIVFLDNVSHSNFSNTGGADTYGPNTKGYGFFADNMGPHEKVLSHFTAYKNSLSSVWFEGTNTIIEECMFADNSTGVFVMQNKLRDCTIVGQSANDYGDSPSTIGTYRMSGGIQIIGHGGPKRPQVADVEIFNQRHAAYITITENGHLEHSYTQGIVMHDVEMPFWYRRDDARSGVEDRDGSLSGFGPSLIVSLNSQLKTNACIDQPDWQASVCPLEDYNVVKIDHLDSDDPVFEQPGLLHSTGFIDASGTSTNQGRGNNWHRYAYCLAGETYQWEIGNVWANTFHVTFEAMSGQGNVFTFENIASDVAVKYLENEVNMDNVSSLAAFNQASGDVYFMNNNSQTLYMKFDGSHSDPVVIQVEHSGGIVNTDETGVEYLEFFPNPNTNGILEFYNHSLKNENLSYSLLDTNGRKVREGKIAASQNQLILSGQLNGVYMIQLHDSNQQLRDRKSVV